MDLSCRNFFNVKFSACTAFDYVSMIISKIYETGTMLRAINIMSFNAHKNPERQIFLYPLYRCNKVRTQVVKRNLTLVTQQIELQGWDVNQTNCFLHLTVCCLLPEPAQIELSEHSLCTRSFYMLTILFNSPTCIYEKKGNFLFT